MSGKAEPALAFAPRLAHHQRVRRVAGSVSVRRLSPVHPVPATR